MLVTLTSKNVIALVLLAMFLSSVFVPKDQGRLQE